MTVRQAERAKKLYREVRAELRQATLCGIAIGLETEYQIVRAEALDSWLLDPTRRPRFLFVANRNTKLEDVEWLLSR